MKRIAIPTLLAGLVAAFLAGCSGTPSKQAAIEDRGIRAEPTQTADGAKIVDASRVETSPAGGGASVAQANAQSADTVKTSGAASERVSAKSVDAVQTHPVAAPGSAGKPLGDAKSGADATPPASADKADSPLPKPDAALTWGDLKNPESPLSKRRLLFDYDSAVIRDEYRAVLEAHAKFMTANKDAKAVLQGHADERGSREYNLALGQRRAESVLKALNLLGVADAQVEAVSFGEEKPVVEGHDESAWQQNRRTEVLYQGE
jgi:peptidoglycan-associated lipoprotein